VSYPKEEPALALVALAATDGRPAAYLRATANAEHGWSKIIEFGCEPGEDEAVRALARAYLAGAFARGVRGLQYPAPCRELAAAIAPFAEASVAVPADYLMLRIPDLTGFLRALVPELSARAAQAGVSHGSVEIAYADQAARIQVVDGRAEVSAAGGPGARAVLEPERWIEVFCGVKPFSTQPFAHTSTVGEPDIVLLDALFPRRDSVFWEIDAF
jgi:hypothetical protein